MGWDSLQIAKINNFFGYTDDDQYIDPVGELKDFNRLITINERRYEDVVRFYRHVDGLLSSRVDLEKQLFLNIEAGFNKISQGNKIDKDYILKLIFYLNDAINLVEMRIDINEAVFFSRLGVSLATFSFGITDKLTEECIAELKAFKALFEKAKKERTETRIQWWLDKGLLIASLIPELSLAKKIVISLGRLSLDQLMGPKGPGIFESAKTTVNHFLSTDSAISKIGAYAPILKGLLSTASVIKKQSEPSELKTVVKSVQELELSIKNTAAKLDLLIEKLHKDALKLLVFQAQLRENQQILKEKLDEWFQLYYSLDDGLKDISYSSPVYWKILQ